MPNTAGVTNRNNPVRREIAVNGSAGQQVTISASIRTGYVEIQEIPAVPYTGAAFTPQGLNYQRADENYVTTYPLTPGTILQIGDAIRKNRCEGVPSFTYPDGVVRPATPFIKVLSATATPTTVEVREWFQLASA